MPDGSPSRGHRWPRRRGGRRGDLPAMACGQWWCATGGLSPGGGPPRATLWTAVVLALAWSTLALAGAAAAAAGLEPGARVTGARLGMIRVDAGRITGTLRSLAGINAGPRGRDGQPDMLAAYRDLGLTSVRTHDYYGAADMHVLFPDLDADPDDPASYSFAGTDRELEAIKRAGADIFFRLGESWGNPRAPVTRVAPENRTAWAQAAVHIARHYNDGWADGFQWNIEYWEVWNEPDIDIFWTGADEEYYALYEATARALKAYDPDLLVGGPGLAGRGDFLAGFLAYCRDHNVPLDFVSWHSYRAGDNPAALAQDGRSIQGAMEAFGFPDAENLLTEWNFSVRAQDQRVRDATGAAWTTSALAYLQDSPVDMTHRYRGDGPLGLIDGSGFYEKPAYAYLAFDRLLDTPGRLEASGGDARGYAVLAGADEAATTVQVLISDARSTRSGFQLTVDHLPWGPAVPYRYQRWALDAGHDLELVEAAEVAAGSDAFVASEAMVAPGVQLIRLTRGDAHAGPRIRVQADQTSSRVSALLYGVNHRYPFGGFGVWDQAARAPRQDVVRRSLDLGLTVARFPGGTVSSTYHWTKGIGDADSRPTGISGFDGAPFTNEYGFDEHMLFVERLGATANVVVNFGTATAQEAAAFVAYANGAPGDPRRIGSDEIGVDWGTVGQWAAQREANQDRLGASPHPYGVEYWEVGNELYGSWEYTWTHDAQKYAAGGTAVQTAEPAVKANDWRDSASVSDGGPRQVFFVRYPPVVTGTQSVAVGGTTWTPVADLGAAAADARVYTFDPLRGEIRFGDGDHGRVPPRGEGVTITYLSGPHDGLADYYAVMKAVDPEIRVGSCFTSDAFLQAVGSDQAYDFVAIHPYEASGDLAGGGIQEAHLRTMAAPARVQARIEDLRAGIDLYAGRRAADVAIAVTEYNLYVPPDKSPAPHYGMALDQALFAADTLRRLAQVGVPLANLHSLISAGEGEGWGNTSVISPYPDLVMRSGGLALGLVARHMAGEIVTTVAEGMPLITGSVPALETAAARDEEGRHLTLLAINKDSAQAVTAEVSIDGFVPRGDAVVWTLTGRTITAFNSAAHPQDVAVSPSVLPEPGAAFEYTFPPRSVTLIDLGTRAESLYLPWSIRGGTSG